MSLRLVGDNRVVSVIEAKLLDVLGCFITALFADTRCSNIGKSTLNGLRFEGKQMGWQLQQVLRLHLFYVAKVYELNLVDTLTHNTIHLHSVPFAVTLE